MPRYKVMVWDNFHYQDSDERWALSRTTQGKATLLTRSGHAWRSACTIDTRALQQVAAIAATNAILPFSWRDANAFSRGTGLRRRCPPT